MLSCLVWHCKVRQGNYAYVVQSGEAGSCKVSLGGAWHCLAWFGIARQGKDYVHCDVGCCQVRLCMARQGVMLIRLGQVK